MKYLALILISILSLIYIRDLFAQNNYSDNHITSYYISAINNDFNNSHVSKHQNLENPFRRLEVTFFISLPFSFIITFMTIQIFDVLKEKGDMNVDVWGDYGNYLISGTLALSSIISIREAIICNRMNREIRKKTDDQVLHLSVIKRY
ncbi:MAG: hypothetical protein SVZ03_00585 [Spirochaetota bacterium]|nr:hypothetical protein [Spirochaetota bacterium]